MGWRLPGYVLERRIGTGASGEVWRARVAATGDLVALKRVPLDDPSRGDPSRGDPSRGDRARTEAALLSSLDHPHLVRLHAVIPTDDAVVLVLDLAAGGSLAQMLARRCPLTPGEVVTALSPVAAALEHAHAHGVIHGDVSAANVLFTEIGLPLLADLGIARLLRSRRTGEFQLGGPAGVHVTPAYAEPLVAAGGLATAASDVFMLGAVALHALTGRSPWVHDGDPADVRAEVLLGRAVRADFGPGGLAGRVAGLPVAVRAVVERALDAEPARRGSAADFALDLRCAHEPAPVELRAGAGAADRGDRTGSGRSVPAGPRHAAPIAARTAGARRVTRPRWRGRPADAGTRPVRRREGPTGSDARPDFARPRAVRAADGVGGLLTQAALAPPRPVLPPVRGSRRRGAGSGGVRTTRTIRLAVALLAGGLAVIAAVVLLRPSAAGRATAAAVASRSPGETPAPTLAPTPALSAAASAAVSPAASPVVTPSSTASPSGPASTPSLTAERIEAELDRLDRIRESAYEQADPSLLTQVYGSGDLADSDARRLASLVPAGCSLVGVRTVYTLTSWRQLPGGGAQVVAEATLPVSTLTCPGRQPVTVSGVGRTTLAITLTPAAGGLLITGQRAS